MNYRDIYRDEKFGEILFDEPMSSHTSFGIGGKCDVFAAPKTEDQLIEILKFNSKNNIKTTIIGKGTNLLVSDKGIRGCVICIGKNYSGITVEGTIIRAMAGEALSKVSKIALKNSLSGMEEISGIPGTIGGAVAMNAGAYGGEIKDIALSVRLLDMSGNVYDYTNDQMNFSYRHSKVFEEDLIVSSVVFQLKRSNEDEIREKYQDYTNRRRTKQPLDKKSAGSTFKRPKGSFASKLIDVTGLRGYRIGDCQVSEKHCGFIINCNEATCDEMLSFIDDVKQKVKKHTGYDLEMEVKRIGDF